MSNSLGEDTIRSLPFKPPLSFIISSALEFENRDKNLTAKP